MKFENIKVGDEVLIPKGISLGWRNTRTFRCLSKVVRVTKTQFVTEGDNRFRKDNGKLIGDSRYYSFCNKEGDYEYGKTLVDQTEEFNEFRKKVTLYNSIVKELSELKLVLDNDLDSMTIIYDKVMDIKSYNTPPE